MLADIFPELDVYEDKLMFTLTRRLSPKQIFNIIESEPELIQIVDMRPYEEFTASRIKSACRVPLSELPGLLERVERKQLIVLVDKDGSEAKVKIELLSQFSNVVFLEGGFDEWKKQKLPTISLNN